MPVNTRDKRGSAINVAGSPVLPNPDGSISDEDRAQLAGAYRMEVVELGRAQLLGGVRTRARIDGGSARGGVRGFRTRARL